MGFTWFPNLKRELPSLSMLKKKMLDSVLNINPSNMEVPKLCMDGCKMAARSKKATKSCCHVQSTNFINVASKKQILHEEVLVLFDLVSKKRIDRNRMDDLTSTNNEAKASNEVAVGSYFPTEEDRQTYYLSVYTGTRESYSPLGRTISCGMGGHEGAFRGFFSYFFMDATAKHLVAEKVTSLDKKANNLAQQTETDLQKAIPEIEHKEGLCLFNIVNQSMKRLKRVKSGRVSITYYQTGSREEAQGS